MIKILMTAECFGYGPVVTGLNVAKELIKHSDVQLSFIGTGVALEQAKMSGYFKNIKECKTYDEKHLHEIKYDIMSNDIVIASENIPGAKYALSLGHKCVFYIDNLMWMWDKIHDGLENLTGYIISETLPCKENFKKIVQSIKHPIFVGPLRDTGTVVNTAVENKLIINIGGCEAFIIDSSILIEFYNKLINQILQNTEIVNRFKKIVVCGGGTVINNIKQQKPNTKVCIKVLSNKDYLNEISTASHLILSSGLGNFYESLIRNKQIMYLPPVNYSQLLQEIYYDKMNLGFDILGWDKFDFYKSVEFGLDEESGVNRVIESVKQYIQTSNSDVIDNSIHKFLSCDQSTYFSNRLQYANGLGKDSNKTIAEIILQKFKDTL